MPESEEFSESAHEFAMRVNRDFASMRERAEKAEDALEAERAKVKERDDLLTMYALKLANREAVLARVREWCHEGKPPQTEAVNVQFVRGWFAALCAAHDTLDGEVRDE